MAMEDMAIGEPPPAIRRDAPNVMDGGEHPIQEIAVLRGRLLILDQHGQGGRNQKRERRTVAGRIAMEQHCYERILVSGR